MRRGHGTKAEQKQMSNTGETLTLLSQDEFPCDLSTAELSDTSSAALTRRRRALIEVGLSQPRSPMILFSMGQWKVGGTLLSTQHWWDCYLPATGPLRGC